MRNERGNGAGIVGGGGDRTMSTRLKQWTNDDKAMRAPGRGDHQSNVAQVV